MRASDWPGLARTSPFEEAIDDLTSAFDHILEVRASGWLRQPRLVDESIWCPRFPSLAEVTTRVVTSVGTSFLQFCTHLEDELEDERFGVPDSFFL